MKFRARLLYKLRRAAKVSLCPGQHNDAVAFALTDDRARREHFAGRLVGVFRFAGKRRLVHAHGSREKFDVRRDDVAGAHTNDVAGNQLPGGNDLPARIATDARADLQALPQCLYNASGTPFLHEAQHSVDNQQCADHSEISIIPERG